MPSTIYILFSQNLQTLRSQYDLKMMSVRMVAVMMAFLTSSAVATLHKVGDGQGWSLNVNYTEWSAGQEFYVGEWLLFNFDKHYYTVFEVNQTNFEYCNEKGFITNITRGGRDVFQLKEARPYYFISSGGYCFHGMKLALVVQEQPSSPPAVAPSPNASPKSLASCTQILILCLIVVSIGLVTI